MAKWITLEILVVAFLVGCIGSWFEVFNLDSYKKFLLTFSPFYLGLVASIGTNSVVEKIQERKEKANLVNGLSAGFNDRARRQVIFPLW